MSCRRPCYYWEWEQIVAPSPETADRQVPISRPRKDTMPPELPVPPNTTIASHDSYPEALSTVSFLHDRGIPTASLSILGAGLRQLEQPARGATVRLTLAGAGNGAWIGALVGMLIAFFASSPSSGLTVVSWAIVYAVLFGALRGFIQGLARSRPGAHRWESVVATRYEVHCVPADASVAVQLLTTQATDPALRPADPQALAADLQAADPALRPADPEPLAADPQPADPEPLAPGTEPQPGDPKPQAADAEPPAPAANPSDQDTKAA